MNLSLCSHVSFRNFRGQCQIDRQRGLTERPALYVTGDGEQLGKGRVGSPGAPRPGAKRVDCTHLDRVGRSRLEAQYGRRA